MKLAGISSAKNESCLTTQLLRNPSGVEKTTCSKIKSKMLNVYRKRVLVQKIHVNDGIAHWELRNVYHVLKLNPSRIWKTRETSSFRCTCGPTPTSVGPCRHGNAESYTRSTKRCGNYPKAAKVYTCGGQFRNFTPRVWNHAFLYFSHRIFLMRKTRALKH